MPAYLNGQKVAVVRQFTPTSIDQYEVYSGPYTVDPLTQSNTVLSTAQKILEQNVTVNKVRFEEVSNNSGGNTVYIGL